MSRYKFDDANHIHLLDEKPLMGTSTVTSVLAKPLTWWASGLAVEKFGWKNPDPKKNSKEDVEQALDEGYNRVCKLSKEEYKKLLDEAYRAHSKSLKKAAGDGTDMHAELEKYVLKCLSEGGKPLPVGDEIEAVKRFAEWAILNVDHFVFCEGHTYSERLWVGGIFDVLFVGKDGKNYIGDFKSSKEAYVSQFIQIGGYDIQLRESGVVDADGNQVATKFEADGYYVFPFGAKEFAPAVRYGTEELRKGFESALTLYKLTNN